MKKKHAVVVGTIIGVYVLSYVVLSVPGRYAVSAWHLVGVRGPWPLSYRWAPIGFYDPATGEWRRPLMCLYLPLWMADGQLWHTQDSHPELTHEPTHPAVFPAGEFK